jgi:hypothetical protein
MPEQLVAVAVQLHVPQDALAVAPTVCLWVAVAGHD